MDYKKITILLCIFILLSGTVSAGLRDWIKQIRQIIGWKTTTIITTTITSTIPTASTINLTSEVIDYVAQEGAVELLAEAGIENIGPYMLIIEAGEYWSKKQTEHRRNLCIEGTTIRGLREGCVNPEGCDPSVEEIQCLCKKGTDRTECCNKIFQAIEFGSDYSSYNVWNMLIEDELCDNSKEYKIEACSKYFDTGFPHSVPTGIDYASKCEAMISEMEYLKSKGIDYSCRSKSHSISKISTSCSEGCPCFMEEPGHTCYKDEDCFSGYCKKGSILRTLGTSGVCEKNPNIETTTTTPYKKYSYRDCKDGDVWWFDSNKDSVQFKQDCTLNQQCVGGRCIGEATTTTICYNNDLYDHKGCYNNYVYWFDSCDNRRKVIKRCFEEYGGTCINGECYRNGQHVTTSSVKGVTTTLKGSITTTTTKATTTYQSYTEHFYKKCYNGDVWWYDSYFSRVELYKECDSDETCQDKNCVMKNAPTTSVESWNDNDCAYKACYQGNSWCYYADGRRSRMSFECKYGRVCVDGKCMLPEQTTTTTEATTTIYNPCVRWFCYENAIYCQTSEGDESGAPIDECYTHGQNCKDNEQTAWCE